MEGIILKIEGKMSLGKLSACIYATERRLWIELAYSTGVLVK